jgi:hypothetical protein
MDYDNDELPPAMSRKISRLVPNWPVHANKVVEERKRQLMYSNSLAVVNDSNKSAEERFVALMKLTGESIDRLYFSRFSYETYHR